MINKGQRSQSCVYPAMLFFEKTLEAITMVLGIPFDSERVTAKDTSVNNNKAVGTVSFTAT